MSNIIANMLTENTGRHFLDSGDAYGRHWQRNAGRKFDQEPAATLSFKYGPEVTLNVYHWLKERVSLSESMDRKFKRFCQRPDQKDSHYLANMVAFPEFLRDERGCEVGGIYGEGEPVVVNTYNGEDLLSQVLQFVYFRCDGTDYVILQIHGGADVRGGYTAPRVFEVTGEELCMFDNARATIYCTGDHNACGAYWDTDDANHWYREGACGMGAGTQLEAYDRTEEDKGESWEVGKLHVRSDGSGLCPCCGSPLAASAHPA